MSTLTYRRLVQQYGENVAYHLFNACPFALVRNDDGTALLLVRQDEPVQVIHRVPVSAEIVQQSDQLDDKTNNLLHDNKHKVCGMDVFYLMAREHVLPLNEKNVYLQRLGQLFLRVKQEFDETAAQQQQIAAILDENDEAITDTLTRIGAVLGVDLADLEYEVTYATPLDGTRGLKLEFTLHESRAARDEDDLPSVGDESSVLEDFYRRMSGRGNNDMLH